MPHINFGWKPDSIDPRDRKISFKTADISKLPKTIDLREKCSPVENQTSLGSCTANAAAGALEYLEMKDGVSTDNFENFSRLFIYYNARNLERDVNADSGVSLRETLTSLNKTGACDEVLWPYDISKFAIKPTDNCYIDANNHKIIEYLGIYTFEDMIACLANGFPFIFGFQVYESFMTPQMAKTGILSNPLPNEKSVGWHAVCAVGYDMNSKTILLRNSWGADWGQGGYFTMPFDYVDNGELAQDFWTIRRIGVAEPKSLSFFQKIVNFFKKLFGK